MFGCVYACDYILGKMNGCMHDAIVACNEKFLNSAFSLSSMFTKPSHVCGSNKVGRMYVVPYLYIWLDTCYLLYSMCIMHTCIAYSSCITLIPCFTAIKDSSGSSCIWGWKGGRLVRTDSSLKSIAKEILRKLEKSPINSLCLEAAPTTVEQTEEMKKQQGGNWTLEDIKGALMDDMKAMMQEELR